MNKTNILLDPTNEKKPPLQNRNARPSSLASLTIGLLDISKAKGDVFLDEIEKQLEMQNLTIKRFCKPTHTRVAPPDLQREIAQACDVVIEALAD